MAVTLPVARPPGADNWLSFSAVRVSAAARPQPGAGQQQGRPGDDRPGRGNHSAAGLRLA
jgi:hypothetical protein